MTRTDPPVVVTTLPAEGYLRLADIIGRRDPDGRLLERGLLPVSKATWLRGVRSGIYPRPIRHGGASLYRVADIRALLERIGGEASAAPDLPPAA